MDESETGHHVDIPGLPDSETKGKKGKKKMSSKKTLSLQSFLSENNNSSSAQATERPSTSEKRQETANNKVSMNLTANEVNEKHTLDEKEKLVLESCHGYVHDLLKQLGPMHNKDPRILDEVNSFPHEAKSVMAKVGGYRKFILSCADLVVVDNIVAAKSDLKAAQDMVFKQIYDNIPDKWDANNGKPEEKDWWSSSSSKNSMWPTVSSSSISTANNNNNGSASTSIWNTTTPAAQDPGDSLFNSRNLSNSSSVTYHSAGGINIDYQPTPIGTSNSSLGQIKSTDGTSSFLQPPPGLSKVDPLISQNRDDYQDRFWQLTSTNNQLLKKLSEKEEELVGLNTKYSNLEAEHKITLNQLEEYKLMYERELKQRGTGAVGDVMPQASRNPENKASDVDSNNRLDSDKELIFTLKKQLEQEQLKSRNLSQTLKDLKCNEKGARLHLGVDDNVNDLLGGPGAAFSASGSAVTGSPSPVLGGTGGVAHQRKSPVGTPPGLGGMTASAAAAAVMAVVNNSGNNALTSSMGGLSVEDDPLGIRSLSVSSASTDISLPMFGYLGAQDLVKSTGVQKSASTSVAGIFGPVTQPPLPGLTSKQHLPPGSGSLLGPLSLPPPASPFLGSQVSSGQPLFPLSSLSTSGSGGNSAALGPPGSANTLLNNTSPGSGMSTGLPSASPAGYMFNSRGVSPTSAAVGGWGGGGGTPAPPNIGLGLGPINPTAGMLSRPPPPPPPTSNHLIAAVAAAQAAANANYGRVHQQQQQIAAAVAANNSHQHHMALSNSRSARQEQLVKKLMTSLPNTSEESIKHYIQVLRDKHGKLSGWATSKIAAEISTLMQQQVPPVPAV